MKSKFTTLTLIVTAFFSLAASAQDKKTKMPDAVRDFVKFIGLWDADVTITIDTVPHKATYRMNFRRTADAYAMNMDEGYSNSTAGSLRAANLIGYSALDSKIHWYYSDDKLYSYERTGNWTDSDNLRFEYNSKRGDKKYNEITTIAFYGNDEFTYTCTSYLNAKQIKKVTGKFIRKNAAAPVQKQ